MKNYYEFISKKIQISLYETGFDFQYTFIMKTSQRLVMVDHVQNSRRVNNEDKEEPELAIFQSHNTCFSPTLLKTQAYSGRVAKNAMKNDLYFFQNLKKNFNTKII